MTSVSKPTLTYIGSMELNVKAPHLPGQTPVGNRRIIRVTDGRIIGDHLNADLIPGGDDWITVREDGTIIQDVRILLQAENEDLILMTYRGIRTGNSSVLQRLDANEDVDPSEYYFRTAPIFETSSDTYDWLNNRVFISTGVRLPGKVQYDIYMVD
ncbi:DUF3237 domain-containing protein [Salicibibacter cibarius]|uniref:UPF0311 protein HUG15_01430 n=1 Tax=Salicibibacter cibarius TaxID=2743000 RepID=A0A7T6Z106_9BACI|nr:DUF3237 domain-containing protein [Salicibibacter cibarius]QQK74396.1 DUF3237 domain-containing protein [Salicibibacter cibarius]